MRVLFTGASSVPGERVLKRMLDDDLYSEIWCSVRKRELAIRHPKLRIVTIDLKKDFSLAPVPRPVDLVVHFAGLTHSLDEELYWKVNEAGTIALAEQARASGCRSFFYLSTRCAAVGNGPYGESKLAAETALKKMAWDSLLILQPAEIYGGDGREGIDQMVWLAARMHVVPLLWGNSQIRFAPVHIEDFVECVCRLLHNQTRGIRSILLCGPEQLSGVSVGLRLALNYVALPIPVWWPAFTFMLRLFSLVGWNPVTPDQLCRLVGPKTGNVSSDLCRPLIRFEAKQNSVLKPQS